MLENKIYSRDTHTHTHSINRFSRLLYPSSGPFRNETKGYGVRETTRTVSVFLPAHTVPQNQNF